MTNYDSLSLFSLFLCTLSSADYLVPSVTVNSVNYDDFSLLCAEGIPLLMEDHKPRPCHPRPWKKEQKCPTGFWCHDGEEATTFFCCPNSRKVSNHCHLPPATGYGKELMRRFYYDWKTDGCHELQYTGIGGNQNSYISYDECEAVCRGSGRPYNGTTKITKAKANETSPSKEKKTNREKKVKTKTNQQTTEARPFEKVFITSPPRKAITTTTFAKVTRPATETTSQTRVKTSKMAVITTSTSSVVFDPNPCDLSPDIGQSGGIARKMWYFDKSARNCVQFTYLGNGGNSNKFESSKECMTVCGIGKPTRKACNLAPSLGDGKYKVPRYYFDKSTRQCELFYYTGKNGNDNRFYKKHKCERLCLKKKNKKKVQLAGTTTALPCTKAASRTVQYLIPSERTTAATFPPTHKSMVHTVDYEPDTTTSPILDNTQHPTLVYVPQEFESIVSTKRPTLIPETFEYTHTPNVDSLFSNLMKTKTTPDEYVYATGAPIILEKSQIGPLPNNHNPLGNFPTELKFQSINGPMPIQPTPESVEIPWPSSTGDQNWVNPSGSQTSFPENQPNVEETVWTTTGQAVPTSRLPVFVSSNIQPAVTYQTAKPPQQPQTNLQGQQSQWTVGTSEPSTVTNPIVPVNAANQNINQNTEYTSWNTNSSPAVNQQRVVDYNNKPNLPVVLATANEKSTTIRPTLATVNSYQVNNYQTGNSGVPHQLSGPNSNLAGSWPNLIITGAQAPSETNKNIPPNPKVEIPGYLPVNPQVPQVQSTNEEYHPRPMQIVLTGLTSTRKPMEAPAPPPVANLKVVPTDTYTMNLSKGIRPQQKTKTEFSGYPQEVSTTKGRSFATLATPVPLKTTTKSPATRKELRVEILTLPPPTTQPNLTIQLVESYLNSPCRSPLYGDVVIKCSSPEITCPAGTFCQIGDGQSMCCPVIEGNACDQNVEKGIGPSSITRWYYDPATSHCHSFVFAGFQGNQNNFATYDSCRRSCKARNPCMKGDPHAPSDPSKQCSASNACPSGSMCHSINTHAVCCPNVNVTVENPCHHSIDKGYGRESHHRWGYDPQAANCISFIFGGKGGNKNNFLTKKDCQNVCQENIPPRCLLPPKSGHGNNFLARYFYSPEYRQCLHFIYSGEGANENNFLTQQDCLETCVAKGVKFSSLAALEPSFSFSFLPSPTCPQGKVLTDSEGKPITCGVQNGYTCPADHVCRATGEASYCCPAPESFCLEQRPALSVCPSGGIPVKEIRFTYDPLADKCIRFTYNNCAPSQSLNLFNTKPTCMRLCCNQGYNLMYKRKLVRKARDSAFGGLNNSTELN